MNNIHSGVIETVNELTGLNLKMHFTDTAKARKYTLVRHSIIAKKNENRKHNNPHINAYTIHTHKHTQKERNLRDG